jgi:adenine deaminase
MNKINVEYKKSLLASFLAGMLMIFIAGASQAQQPIFDVVFKQGRVIDPETKLDAIRDVGITGKKIISVSAEPLKGKVEIDAKGKILGPGFID